MIKMMYSTRQAGRGKTTVFEGAAVVAGETNEFSYEEMCKCTSSTITGLGRATNIVSMHNI